MVDINQLTKPACSAAMRGGTNGWGQMGSAKDDVRYAEPVAAKSRQRCSCGCGRRATHLGMANGVALTTGCELVIRRWVKTGSTKGG